MTFAEFLEDNHLHSLELLWPGVSTSASKDSKDVSPLGIPLGQFEEMASVSLCDDMVILPDRKIEVTSSSWSRLGPRSCRFWYSLRFQQSQSRFSRSVATIGVLQISLECDDRADFI